MDQFKGKDFKAICEAYEGQCGDVDEGVWDSAKRLAGKAAKGTAKLAGRAAAGTLKAGARAVAGTAKYAGRELLDAGKSIARGVSAATPTVARGVKRAATASAEELAKGVVGTAKLAGKGAWGATKLAGKTLAGAVTGNGRKIRRAWKDAGRGLGRTVGDVERSAGRLADRVGGGLADGASAVADGIASTALGAAKYAGRGLADAGKTVVRGVRKTGGDAVDAVKNTARSASDEVNREIADIGAERAAADAEKSRRKEERNAKLERGRRINQAWKDRSEKDHRRMAAHDDVMRANTLAEKKRAIERGKALVAAWKRNAAEEQSKVKNALENPVMQLDMNRIRPSRSDADTALDARRREDFEKAGIKGVDDYDAAMENESSERTDEGMLGGVILPLAGSVGGMIAGYHVHPGWGTPVGSAIGGTIGKVVGDALDPDDANEAYEDGDVRTGFRVTVDGPDFERLVDAVVRCHAEDIPSEVASVLEDLGVSDDVIADIGSTMDEMVADGWGSGEDGSASFQYETESDDYGDLLLTVETAG